MEVPMRVWRVGQDAESHYLLIFLDDSETPLPMSIGMCEAISIAVALNAESAEIPPLKAMTHDLLCDMITSLGGRLLKVVVDDYWHGVYYAKLHLEVDSTVVTVDSRPSDAVAVALRMGAPLYVVDAVLEAANRPDSPSEAPQEEDAGLWDELEEL
jgi:hypothetical protein